MIDALGGGVLVDVRRMAVLAMVLVILPGGIAAAAVADHRHKNARMGPASVASWYCQNRGQRCDQPQSDDIEAAWQKRERIYRVSFWATSLGAMTALVVTLRQRYVDKTTGRPRTRPLRRAAQVTRGNGRES
jgi:hypothetical protein